MEEQFKKFLKKFYKEIFTKIVENEHWKRKVEMKKGTRYQNSASFQ